MKRRSRRCRLGMSRSSGTSLPGDRRVIAKQRGFLGFLRWLCRLGTGSACRHGLAAAPLVLPAGGARAATIAMHVVQPALDGAQQTERVCSRAAVCSQSGCVASGASNRSQSISRAASLTAGIQSIASSAGAGAAVRTACVGDCPIRKYSIPILQLTPSYQEKSWHRSWQLKKLGMLQESTWEKRVLRICWNSREPVQPPSASPV